MRTFSLLDLFDSSQIEAEWGNLVIQGLSKSTQELRPRDIFVICEGRSFDIYSVLPEIAEIPSVFIAPREKRCVVEKILPGIPVIYVGDVHQEMMRLLDLLYPFTGEDISIIGVTGTNGKTTVSTIIEFVLKQLGERCALLGTLQYRVGEQSQEAFLTTPDYVTLRKLLFQCRENHIKYVIMEVSSHSIVQDRIKNIPFRQCIFTNLSRDHLDYHHTMEKYFQAKQKFFIQNEHADKIINYDDSFGIRLCRNFTQSVFRYGQSDACEYKIGQFWCDKKGGSFSFHPVGKGNNTYKVAHNLMGEHNSYNIAAAVISLDRLGISFERSIPVLRHFQGVCGRLQQVIPDVYVDYAHTPDAFLKVLNCLTYVGYENIVTVFGCGGNRDKGKRSMMGRISCENAAFSIITSDNPRDEDPLSICDHIKEGFTQDNYMIIPEREKAIRSALFLKEYFRNAALLIAGKGHESYQIIKKEKIPFSDIEVIQRCNQQNNSYGKVSVERL